MLACVDCHLALGEPDKALHVISVASETEGENETVLRRHVAIARAVGDLAEWRTALDRLIALLPNDANVHWQRSVLANQLGDAFLYWRSLETADSLFLERARQGDVSGLCGLVRTRRRTGQQESFEALLRVLIAEAHRRPIARVIDEAAESLVAMGDVAGLAFLADGIRPELLDHGGRIALADLLVRLERTERAIELVEELRPRTKRQAELLAWAAAQRGEIEAARELTAGFSYPASLDYLRIYDSALPLGLEPVGEPPSADRKDPVVITMTRNERDRLPEWLAHYRDLGFTRFMAIDNGSTDGTREYFEAQPDVSLFTSDGDFRRYASGRRWVNHIIENHCGDSWCFVIDADELLVFPDDHLGIAHLVAELDSTSSQIMFAVALDMHADRLDAWDDDHDQPLQERFPLFDSRTRIIGSRHAPYLGACGGLRNHQLAQIMPENLLSRPVAIRAGAGVRFLNPHMTNPGTPSAVTGALLHYKFAVNPNTRLGIPTAKGVFMQYLGQDLASVRDLDLRSEHSVRYEDSEQLVRLGILRDGRSTI